MCPYEKVKAIAGLLDNLLLVLWNDQIFNHRELFKDFISKSWTPQSSQQNLGMDMGLSIKCEEPLVK